MHMLSTLLAIRDALCLSGSAFMIFAERWFVHRLIWVLLP